MTGTDEMGPSEKLTVFAHGRLSPYVADDAETWDEECLLILNGLKDGMHVDRSRLVALIEHAREALSGHVPDCLTCGDDGAIETPTGSWVRCGGCR